MKIIIILAIIIILLLHIILSIITATTHRMRDNNGENVYNIIHTHTHTHSNSIIVEAAVIDLNDNSNSDEYYYKFATCTNWKINDSTKSLHTITLYLSIWAEGVFKDKSNARRPFGLQEGNEERQTTLCVCAFPYWSSSVRGGRYTW